MIKASALPLGLVFLFGEFEPAPVQREFQWSATEASLLLDDIFSAFEVLGLDPEGGKTEITQDTDHDHHANGHEDGLADKGNDDDLEFDASALEKVKLTGRGRRKPPELYNLNMIVLYKKPIKENSYFVFDGMQRLTTLALLFVALRDSSNADSLVANLIEPLLFLDGANSKRRLKFPSKGSTLAALLNGVTVPGGALASGDLRMREVHKFLAEKVQGWSEPRRAAFVQYLLRKVYLTVQTLSDMSLAYQTFVAANDRGLSLSIGDILKGYVVEQANARRATARQIERIERCWNEARGKLHAHGMRQFIPAIEALKFGFDRRAAPGERLMSLFDDTSMPDDIVAWMEGEFLQIAEIFARQRLHHSNREVTGADFRFRQLSFLGWDDWQPVALALGMGHTSGFQDDSWKKKINLLYRASYTMELLGWTAGRKTRMAQAVEALQNGQNPFAEDRRNKKYGVLTFSSYLKGIAMENLARPFIQPERRGAVTRWLETLYWDHPVPLSATANATIEHVLPVTPNEYWARYFTPEQCDRLTNLVGNLCILEERANLKIGNASWPEKKRTYKQWDRRFKMVGHVINDGGEEWSEEKIIARTKQLAIKGAVELGLNVG